MKILYMGTPDFAVPPLQQLINSGHDICAVITQPDRPKGRGMRLAPPPVKQLAITHNIPVYQPEKLKDNAILQILTELSPELIVVVAYGRLLPKYILDFPEKGCINVHGSLLPKYRGAAPIQHAVLNGDRITGISTMFMSEGLDTGDVILSRECAISEEDTTESMFERLSILGAQALMDTIRLIENGLVAATPQDDTVATYASMIKKEDCRINWNQSAQQILNLIRGSYSWPIAFTFCKLGRIKIFRASAGSSSGLKPGTVVCIDNIGMQVAAGDGKTVIVKELQFDGSRRMTPEEYLRGHESITGDVLN